MEPQQPQQPVQPQQPNNAPQPQVPPQPVQQQPQQPTQQPFQTQQPQPVNNMQPQGNTKNDNFAIWGFVTALIGFLAPFVYGSMVLGGGGLALSILAKKGNTSKGGLAIAGIVIGSLAILGGFGLLMLGNIIDTMQETL